MKTGVVKFFKKEKGFGFIVNDVTKEEIFFHVSEVEGKVDLNSDDRVQYEEGEGKKGVMATKISLV